MYPVCNLSHSIRPAIWGPRPSRRDLEFSLDQLGSSIHTHTHTHAHTHAHIYNEISPHMFAFDLCRQAPNLADLLT